MATSRGRWWDGCDRAVVGSEQRRFIGSGHTVTVLALECGHKQTKAPHGHERQLGATICRECSRLGRRAG